MAVIYNQLPFLKAKFNKFTMAVLSFLIIKHTFLSIRATLNIELLMMENNKEILELLLARMPYILQIIETIYLQTLEKY